MIVSSLQCHLYETQLNVFNIFTFTATLKYTNFAIFFKIRLLTRSINVMIFRYLVKSYLYFIFLKKALDSTFAVVSGKEFQGITTLEHQKCFLVSVLQCC